MTQTIRVADYIMERLARLGVGQVYFLPGGGAMHLNDALGRHPELEPVLCLHEQAAAIAAEAAGKLTGGPAACMTTCGPGATNTVTAVLGAWLDSTPVFFVSGQVKSADLKAGSGLRMLGVQEADIVSIVAPITKAAVTLTDPEAVAEVFDQLEHAALSGRRGPVWLDVPLDVQAAQVDPARLRRAAPPAPVQRIDLSEPLAQTLALLRSAKRPGIIAGNGIRMSGAVDAFRRLIERAGIPVMPTWQAMDLIEDEHPLYGGRPGSIAPRWANFALQNCDLLISIGCRLDNIITAYNPRGFSRAAKKIVIDVDRHEIDKLDMDIAIGVTADAADFLAALDQAVAAPAPARPGWLARIADWKARYPVNDGQPFPASGPIDHYHFVSALSAAIPPDTLVATGSSGLAIEVFYTVFQNKRGQRVFLTSGLGSMGYGLPAAIGACFANGKKPMVAVESDGSLQLNLQELATLRAQKLPICLIVMNNGGYASIRSTQRNYFAGRHVGTGPEAGLLLPDLEQVAATYGLPFRRITDAADLAPVLKEVAGHPQAMIVDVQLTPNEILAPKCAALPQPDGSMLSMPLEDMSPLLPLAELEAQMIVPLLPQSRAARPAPPG